MSANLVNFFILKKQICLLLFMLSQVSSGHEDDMHTVQYTQETFLEEIKKKNSFVMFYAPWYVKYIYIFFSSSNFYLNLM